MIKNKYLRIALVALAILFAFGALSSLLPDRTSTKSTTKKPTSNGSTNNNTPIVYNVDSIDDLPETAVEGSLAVIESDDSILGKWSMNMNLSTTGIEDLSAPDAHYDFNVKGYAHNQDYQIPFSYIYVDCNSSGCISVGAADDELGTDLTIYSYGDLFNGGLLSISAVNLTIESIPADKEVESFIRENGKKTNSVYIYENGNWVYYTDVYK